MEPTPAKPVKKRRRWLIVAFVLALLSVCLWWYWPRCDGRFVGRWAGRGEIWEFRADGSFVHHTFKLDSDLPTTYRWFISGSRFYQTRNAVGPAKELSNSVAHFWNVVRGHEKVQHTVVEEVTADVIKLREVFPGPFDDSHVVVLIRLPE